MRNQIAAVLAVLLLITYTGAAAVIQYTWDHECPWVVTMDTPVYTPGQEDEVAALLPAGTGCRVDASVGDTWQAIEYMIDGKTFTGMVRAESLRRR